MGTAQAGAVAIVCGRAPRDPGHAPHTERGQGGGDRQRPRRQGAGRRHGDQAAALLDARPGRRPDALALAICNALAWRRARPDRRAVAEVAPMIASVRGRRAPVRRVRVVEVGGVGLAVLCTPRRSRLAGARGALSTALVVREDSLTLYGFADDDEREVFEQLQAASGVGPRLAQAVLGVHSPDDVRRAIATEDLTALTRVPGSAARAPSASSWSSRTGSVRPGRTRRRPSASRRRARQGGGPRCTRRCWGSAGRPARPTRRSRPWPPDAASGTLGIDASDGARDADVPTLLRAALRTLSRT
jgi:Holliday junction DNA helicase RuvA